MSRVRKLRLQSEAQSFEAIAAREARRLWPGNPDCSGNVGDLAQAKPSRARWSGQASGRPMRGSRRWRAIRCSSPSSATRLPVQGKRRPSQHTKGKSHHLIHHRAAGQHLRHGHFLIKIPGQLSSKINGLSKRGDDLALFENTSLLKRCTNPVRVKASPRARFRPRFQSAVL